MTPESTTDYARVEAAIRWLAERAPAQPSLAELAESMGVSEFHCQRVFTRWCGISPKRFAQFQTLAHARRVLAESRNVFGAALDAGMSGGGRLHDLFVTVEAMTPGEYRQGGAGLVVRYGVVPTPFGRALVATTERGVCALEFVDGRRDGAGEDDDGDPVAALAERWPRATLVADAAGAGAVAARIFDGAARERAPLALLLKGTNLQLKVWEALLRVPEGALVTYEDLAARVGRPDAVRAVASAVGRNPIAYLIPCHRVIRKTGIVGEYRWGSPRKRAILGWEAAARERDGSAKPARRLLV